MKSISVIIPALNEELYIGDTLGCLAEATRLLQASHPFQLEVIVVDNDSSDRTADIARELGAIVAVESVRNIARARNVGAGIANSELLFFLDADTLVPPEVLLSIAAAAADACVIGGAVDTNYRPASPLVRLYLRGWRLLGRLTGIAQGAAQFCRRNEFFVLGGYDEKLFMGEDVDFYGRMRRMARKTGGRVCYFTDVRVTPSPRRFDRWPLCKTILWTNPILIATLRRHKRAWPGWYEDVPR